MNRLMTMNYRQAVRSC